MNFVLFFLLGSLCMSLALISVFLKKLIIEIRDLKNSISNSFFLLRNDIIHNNTNNNKFGGN